MDNLYLVLALLLVGLVIVSGVQAIQLADLKSKITGAASGGETYDEMMARMHPDQVQKQTQSAMVGGC